MGAVVRPMASGDLAAAAAIEATAPEAWSREALAEELRAQQAGGAPRLFIAERQGQIAGLAALQLAAGEATLNTITVAPALRGRGIGKALLGEALAALRAQGAHSCFLEVRAHNAPAIALYTGLGFAVVGWRRGFYRAPTDDALVMRLEL